MIASVLVPLAAAGLATAKSIQINAGSKGLSFDPDTVTADVGDTLEFFFYPNNHSVAQGDFSQACQPVSSGGFASGFFPVSEGEANQKFVVTVTNTDPIFFYCPAPGHCKGGMVGVVNPSGTQSLDAYKTAVAAATTNVIPTGVFGGQVVATDASVSGSSTESSGTATSTSGTARATSTGSGASTTSASRTTGSTAAGASATPSSTTSRSSAPTNAAFGVLDGGSIKWAAAGAVLLRGLMAL